MPSLCSMRDALRRGAVLLPLAVAACAGGEALPAPEPSHRLTVDRVEHTHTVYFDTDVDRPSADERRRLAAFLKGLDPSRRMTFRVSGHADDRAGESYNVALSARRARAVGDLIRDRGFVGDQVATTAFGEKAPAAEGLSAPARSRNRRVDIAVDAWTLELSGCPDWSRDPADTALNYPLGNLGCATTRNLGLMVADPADLASGRPLGAADAIRESEAVVRYRTDKVKELEDGLTAP